MSENEIDSALEAFRAALFTLKPYAAEKAPHLMM
jgi:hypothetical protein